MNHLWSQHLLPTLPPSITRHQTISDRIQQRCCHHTHDSIDKHVSEDAPDPRRPRKTCEQNQCLPSCSCDPRDYTEPLNKCRRHMCFERAVRSISIEVSPHDTLRVSVESRYQAFIASRKRIKSVCTKRRLVQSPHATTIIIAFEM